MTDHQVSTYANVFSTTMKTTPSAIRDVLCFPPSAEGTAAAANYESLVSWLPRRRKAYSDFLLAQSEHSIGCGAAVAFLWGEHSGKMTTRARSLSSRLSDTKKRMQKNSGPISLTPGLQRDTHRHSRLNASPAINKTTHESLSESSKFDEPMGDELLGGSLMARVRAIDAQRALLREKQAQVDARYNEFVALDAMVIKAQRQFISAYSIFAPPKQSELEVAKRAAQEKEEEERRKREELLRDQDDFDGSLNLDPSVSGQISDGENLHEAHNPIGGAAYLLQSGNIADFLYQAIRSPAILCRSRRAQYIVKMITVAQAHLRGIFTRRRYRSLQRMRRWFAVENMKHQFRWWRAETRSSKKARLRYLAFGFAGLQATANMAMMRRSLFALHYSRCRTTATLQRTLVVWHRYTCYLNTKVSDDGVRHCNFAEGTLPAWDRFLENEKKRLALMRSGAALTTGDPLCVSAHYLWRWKKYVTNRIHRRQLWFFAVNHHEMITQRKHFLAWVHFVSFSTSYEAQQRATLQYYLRRWKRAVVTVVEEKKAIQNFGPTKTMSYLVKWRKKALDGRRKRAQTLVVLQLQKSLCLYVLACWQGDETRRAFIGVFRRWRCFIQRRLAWIHYVALRWAKRRDYLKAITFVAWVKATDSALNRTTKIRSKVSKIELIAPETMFEINEECKTSVFRSTVTRIMRRVHALSTEIITLPEVDDPELQPPTAPETPGVTPRRAKGSRPSPGATPGAKLQMGFVLPSSTVKGDDVPTAPQNIFEKEAPVLPLESLNQEAQLLSALFADWNSFSSDRALGRTICWALLQFSRRRKFEGATDSTTLTTHTSRHPTSLGPPDTMSTASQKTMASSAGSHYLLEKSLSHHDNDLSSPLGSVRSKKSFKKSDSRIMGQSAQDNENEAGAGKALTLGDLEQLWRTQLLMASGSPFYNGSRNEICLSEVEKFTADVSQSNFAKNIRQLRRDARIIKRANLIITWVRLQGSFSTSGQDPNQANICDPLFGMSPYRKLLRIYDAVLANNPKGKTNTKTKVVPSAHRYKGIPLTAATDTVPGQEGKDRGSFLRISKSSHLAFMLRTHLHEIVGQKGRYHMYKRTKTRLVLQRAFEELTLARLYLTRPSSVSPELVQRRESNAFSVTTQEGRELSKDLLRSRYRKLAVPRKGLLLTNKPLVFELLDIIGFNPKYLRGEQQAEIQRQAKLRRAMRQVSRDLQQTAKIRQEPLRRTQSSLHGALRLDVALLKTANLKRCSTFDGVRRDSKGKSLSGNIMDIDAVDVSSDSLSRSAGGDDDDDDADADEEEGVGGNLGSPVSNLNALLSSLRLSGDIDDPSQIQGGRSSPAPSKSSSHSPVRRVMSESFSRQTDAGSNGNIFDSKEVRDGSTNLQSPLKQTQDLANGNGPVDPFEAKRNVGLSPEGKKSPSSRDTLADSGRSTSQTRLSAVDGRVGTDGGRNLPASQRITPAQPLDVQGDHSPNQATTGEMMNGANADKKTLSFTKEEKPGEQIEGGVPTKATLKPLTIEVETGRRARVDDDDQGEEVKFDDLEQAKDLDAEADPELGFEGKNQLGRHRSSPHVLTLADLRRQRAAKKQKKLMEAERKKREEEMLNEGRDDVELQNIRAPGPLGKTSSRIQTGEGCGIPSLERLLEINARYNSYLHSRCRIQLDRLKRMVVKMVSRAIVDHTPFDAFNRISHRTGLNAGKAAGQANEAAERFPHDNELEVPGIDSPTEKSKRQASFSPVDSALQVSTSAIRSKRIEMLKKNRKIAREQPLCPSHPVQFKYQKRPAIRPSSRPGVDEEGGKTLRELHDMKRASWDSPDEFPLEPPTNVHQKRQTLIPTSQFTKSAAVPKSLVGLAERTLPSPGIDAAKAFTAFTNQAPKPAPPPDVATILQRDFVRHQVLQVPQGVNLGGPDIYQAQATMATTADLLNRTLISEYVKAMAFASNKRSTDISTQSLGPESRIVQNTSSIQNEALVRPRHKYGVHGSAEEVAVAKLLQKANTPELGRVSSISMTSSDGSEVPCVPHLDTSHYRKLALLPKDARIVASDFDLWIASVHNRLGDCKERENAIGDVESQKSLLKRQIEKLMKQEPDTQAEMHPSLQQRNTLLQLLRDRLIVVEQLEGCISQFTRTPPPQSLTHSGRVAELRQKILQQKGSPSPPSELMSRTPILSDVEVSRVVGYIASRSKHV